MIAGIAVTVLMLRILKPTLQHTAVAAANGVTVADLSETETSDVYTKTETFDSITEIMSDEAIVLGETATTKDGVIEDLVQRLEKQRLSQIKTGLKKSSMIEKRKVRRESVWESLFHTENQLMFLNQQWLLPEVKME